MTKQQSHQMSLHGQPGLQFQSFWGPGPGLSFKEMQRIAALDKPIERKIAIAQRLQRMRRDKWNRENSGPDRPGYYWHRKAEETDGT